MSKRGRPSSFQLSEITPFNGTRKGGGVNKFIRKDLTGVGQADARYRLAVDMVATEEKCWWVNRWLIGNLPLNTEKPR